MKFSADHVFLPIHSLQLVFEINHDRLTAHCSLNFPASWPAAGSGHNVAVGLWFLIQVVVRGYGHWPHPSTPHGYWKICIQRVQFVKSCIASQATKVTHTKNLLWLAIDIFVLVLQKQRQISFSGATIWQFGMSNLMPALNARNDFFVFFSFLNPGRSWLPCTAPFLNLYPMNLWSKGQQLNVSRNAHLEFLLFVTWMPVPYLPYCYSAYETAKLVSSEMKPHWYNGNLSMLLS